MIIRLFNYKGNYFTQANSIATRSSFKLYMQYIYRFDQNIRGVYTYVCTVGRPYSSDSDLYTRLGHITFHLTLVKSALV